MSENNTMRYIICIVWRGISNFTRVRSHPGLLLYPSQVYVQTLSLMIVGLGFEPLTNSDISRHRNSKFSHPLSATYSKDVRIAEWEFKAVT